MFKNIKEKLQNKPFIKRIVSIFVAVLYITLNPVSALGGKLSPFTKGVITSLLYIDCDLLRLELY